MESQRRTFRVARVGLHRYEEPFISGERGSGTVFFCGCDLACVFCQNYEISRHGKGVTVSDDELLKLFFHLENAGAENINLVTPSPWLERLIPVLKEFKTHSELPIVWNSNGCEPVEALKKAEGAVDIWLPDFKYSDDALAWEYSRARNYFERARAALAEMRRQQPEDIFDGRGMMKKGVCVRHLVLPAAGENTEGVMRAIDAIDGTLFVSVMGQYFPTPAVMSHPVLGRRLTEEEYRAAIDAFFSAGLENGFSQELDSATEEYVPDFDPTEVIRILNTPCNAPR